MSLLFVPQLLKFIEWSIPSCTPREISCPDYVSRYGSVGELFGAVNALFSGLALASIALTLWVDSKSRREEKKPFLIASKGSDGAWVIERPKLDGSQVVVSLALDMEVLNQGQEVALNVCISASIESLSVKWEYELQVPLVPAQKSNERMTLQLRGEDLTFVLDKLTNTQKVEIKVVTRYTSMDAVTWETSVVYEVALGADPRDINLVNLIRANTWQDNWQGEAQVPLLMQIKRGSWFYGASKH